MCTDAEDPAHHESIFYMDNLIDSCDIEQISNELWELISETESYQVIDWMVDCGASVSVARTSLNKWLRNASESMIMLSGFSTESTDKADRVGSLAMHALPVDSDTHGVAFELSGINTADHARLNLMSMTEFYEKWGYDVSFKHDGFTGFYKTDPVSGTEVQIPFFHNPRKHCWSMITVVASDIESAETAGDIIESIYPRLSLEMIQSAVNFDVNATMILQKVGGYQKVNHDGRSWNINVDQINYLTEYNPADPASYLPAKAFADSIMLLMTPETEIVPGTDWTSAMCSVPFEDENNMDNDEQSRAVGVIYTIMETEIISIEMAQLDQHNKLVAPALQVDASADLDVINKIREPEFDDVVMGGLKKLLSTANRRKSALEIHRANAHVGYHPDCQVCQWLRLRYNRVYKQIDKYIDPNPCLMFSLDMGIISHRSSRGYKYFCVLRCYNSGWYVLLFLVYKNEFVDKWCAMVDRMRANPLFQYAKYKFMARVRTDFDSVWDTRNKDAVRERETRGIYFEFGDPSDHRKKPRGEKSVRDMEMGCKALMVEFRLPIQWWPEAMESARQAKNLWPMARNVVAIDGDAPAAWELATNGRVSHGMVLEAINKFVSVGTLAMLGNTEILGSNAQSPIRQTFAICIGMDGEPGNLVVWRNLHTMAEVRSNDFSVLTLPVGTSAFNYFGIPAPTLTKAALPVPEDYTIDVQDIIQLQGIGVTGGADLLRHRNELRDRGECSKEGVIVVDSDRQIVLYDPADDKWKRTGDAIRSNHDFGTELTDNTDTIKALKDQLSYDPLSFIGQSIYKDWGKHGVAHGKVTSYLNPATIKDLDEQRWTIVYDDEDSEDFNAAEMTKYCILKMDGEEVTFPVQHSVREQKIDQDDEQDAPAKKCLCGCDATVVLTTRNETYFDLIKRIPFVGEKSAKDYYKYLEERHNYGHHRDQNRDGYYFNDPFNKKSKKSTRQLPADVPFPIPVSGEWMQMLNTTLAVHKLDSDELNPEFQVRREVLDEIEDAKFQALVGEGNLQNVFYLYDEGEDEQTSSAEMSVNVCNDSTATDCDEPEPEMTFENYDASGYDIRRLSPRNVPCNKPSEIPTDPATGKIIGAKGWTQTQMRMDRDEFRAAYMKELGSLIAKKVFRYGYTQKQLKEMGYNQKPLPCAALFEVKYAGEILDKYKVRIVGLGHAGNITPGIHFLGSTYAATPSLDVARIFVAICVYFGWNPDYFDATTAFLNSIARDSEQIPVRMPPELREYDQVTNEEIMAILDRVLYGHPIASLRWSQTRDGFILERFNTEGWTTICMIDREPCLFFMTAPTGNRLILVTHTDDFRIAGDDESEVAFVVAEHNRRFTVTKVTTGIMLGVEIKSGVDANGIRWTELTQTAYIEDMYAMASQYMPENFKVTSPFPTDNELKLSMRDKDGVSIRPDQEEIARNHAKQFRTFVGMLLWVSRNTKMGVSTGLSYLTRVMSCPGDKAFKCLLHLIQYTYQERHSGLMFRSDKEIAPVCWYDASDDRDPVDSITIGGGMIVMCGAAVSWNCGKLLHVGIAGSTQAEYMQLERSMRSVIWLRELLLAAQIYRVHLDDKILGTFGKLSRLYNCTPVYQDMSTNNRLIYIFRHENVDYEGRWAVITELGTADIILLSKNTSPARADGPSPETIWTVRSDTDDWMAAPTAKVDELLRLADIVSEPIVVVGDNINALKWASVDAITPGNKHVRTSYHWIKEHVRDGHVSIRDCPSQINISDFLTKNMQGPHARQMIEAASGYAEQPQPPSALKYIK